MLKKNLGFALPVAALLLGHLAHAEPRSTYRSYLGPECYESRYADHNFRGMAVAQGVAGAVEGYVAIDNLHAISHAQLHRKFAVPSLILLSDGVGRILGGSCAGLTGLDDVTVATLGTGFDALIRPLARKLERSKAVTDAKAKLLPAAPDAGASVLSGTVAQSRSAR